MKDHEFIVVNAFADKAFAGNPAAVMRLDAFCPDDILLAIAQEHNLSETAYLVRREDAYFDLRWFTPGGEVPLCGHATLASGHALLNEWDEPGDIVRFETKSGTLAVAREGSQLRLDLPNNKPAPIASPPSLKDAIGIEAQAVFDGQFWLALLNSEAEVRAVKPNMGAIEHLPVPELGITAPGDNVDFVSRLFAPQLGIPEDPFTGSLHAMLTPFWAERLGKTALSAHQASSRGGDAICRLEGDRVILIGDAVTTIRGVLTF